MILGVIGGSGLYEIEGMGDIRQVQVKTPFGAPSDMFTLGRYSGADMVFLPRHGVGHVIAPFEINHRANLYAMKTLGVTHLLSLSAVGSLKAELAPRDLVLVDQYLDRTKRGGEEHTFFGGGVVAHIAFADPVCPVFRNYVFDRAAEVVADMSEAERPRVVNGGAYVNMEGPAFSTRAESKLYKSWGMDVIGMTNLGEAKLAREAEICYCAGAMVTDYDCWREDHDHVTVDQVIANFKANIALAKRLIAAVASRFAEVRRDCSCADALKGALLTAPDKITPAIRKKLAPILGRYFPEK